MKIINLFCFFFVLLTNISVQAQTQELERAEEAVGQFKNNLEESQILYPPPLSADEVREAIQKAKKAGNKVDYLEEKMVRLEKFALRKKAEEEVQWYQNQVEHNPWGYTLAFFMDRVLEVHSSIKKAKEVGNNVSDLEEKMAELEKELIKFIARKTAKNAVQKFKDYFDIMIDFSQAEEREKVHFQGYSDEMRIVSLQSTAIEAIQEAKEVGNNVSDLEEKMAELEKKLNTLLNF